jgi:hypothetical protein
LGVSQNRYRAGIDGQSISTHGDFMKSRILAATVAAFCAFNGLTAAHAAEQIGGDTAFSFVAMGDMPYKLPDDYAKVDRLIGVINSMKPSFTIHVGDIKSGSSPCSDETFKKAFDQLQTVDQPLLYTPGDNEWTDCHREKAGKFDPRERLAKIREMFFANPEKSLGKNPMAVETQSKAMPKYAKFVENQRFTKNGIMIVSVHVVGSNNGFEAQDPAAAIEFFERNGANVAWLDDSFAKAKETGAKGVVVFFQADPFDLKQIEEGMPRASGMVDTVKAFERASKSFGRPILAIHGDNHTLELKAFPDTSGKPIPNVMKLQLFGEKLHHAMRVIVDPNSPAVFGYMPIIVPENGNF